MSDFDDAIGAMTLDLLVEAGGSFVYVRGNTSTTITLRKSTLQPEIIEGGNGTLIEVRPVDFIGMTTSLPYDPPERGDVIVGGGLRGDGCGDAGRDDQGRQARKTRQHRTVPPELT